MQECAQNGVEAGHSGAWRFVALLSLAWSTGCAAPVAVETAVPPAVRGACGEVSMHALRVRARVQTSQGAPASGVKVALEERNWAPGVRGEGVTDDAGVVAFDATEVVAVAGCWGTAVDYVLAATRDGASVEDPVNPDVREAVEGDGELDLTERPLQLP
jgi:hypothetical protein